MSTDDEQIDEADPTGEPTETPVGSAPESVPEPATPTERRTPGWGRAQVALSAALAIALVASLVCTALLWRERQQSEDLEAAGRDAEAAARSAVARMTTYDHDTVDDDFAWVQDAATPEFADYFAEVSAPAIELIKQLQADATSQVIDSAHRVEDADRVTVLVFVDQTIQTQVETPIPAAPSVDQPRVTVSMVRVGGAWLVEEVALNTSDSGVDPTAQPELAPAVP